MNTKALHTLEFDKMTVRLAEHCSSAPGRALALSLTPVSDPDAIARRLSETQDALRRCAKHAPLSFRGVIDLSEMEEHLAPGATLSPAELLSILSLLKIAARAVAYGLSGDAGDDETADSLTPLFAGIDPLPELAKSIDRSILSETEIADEASPELAAIRRRMRETEASVRDTLNRMLRSQTIRECLTDALITTREGRYCLPVRAEFKSRIPGMVHDQSSSGSTLFIEPMSVVDLNNSLREMLRTEEEEIQKVLSALTASVLLSLDLLRTDSENLAQLDFVFAKALFAEDLNAVFPEMNTRGRVRLNAARHPLLTPEMVVPIDLSLGIDYSTLIVTGPNTGGKTVSLKTLGLLSLMAQSGLFIPAAEGSELAVWDEVYADIGDEQSIEASLSTFSSHMTSIVKILGRIQDACAADPDAGRRSLVLFDELCSGTDPLEGAALATAILDRLLALSVRTMATTHYSELKTYALTTNGAENASCEFDVATLSPTYHLITGIPGKSNAFAISRRLGLDETLISDAGTRLNQNDVSFEDLVGQLEDSRRQLARERAAFESERRKWENRREDVNRREKNLYDRRDKILRDANEKAANILRDAKQTADSAIRSINKYGNPTGPDMSSLEKTRTSLGKKLSTRQEKSAPKAAKKPAASRKTEEHGPGIYSESGKFIPAEKIRLGSSVRVNSMDVVGTIHTLPNARGKVEVQMGILKSQVSLSDLTLLDREADVTIEGQAAEQAVRARAKAAASGKQGSGSSSAAYDKAMNTSSEINLIGLHSDEAVAALDKYLDDASIAHIRTVRVVHGKGTGALRKAISDYLRTQKNVEEFHLAEYGEGDAGVTIVKLK